MATELKELPKNKDGSFANKFTANGVNYRILPLDNALSPTRHIEYSRLSIVGGTGFDFSALITALDEVSRLVFDIDAKDSITRRAPIVKLDSIRAAVVELSSERFEKMMYVCTLFVVREGEELDTWDFDDATEKIEDWNKEGYKSTDFFSLAAYSITDFAATYLQIESELKSRVLDTISGGLR